MSELVKAAHVKWECKEFESFPGHSSKIFPKILFTWGNFKKLILELPKNLYIYFNFQKYLKLTCRY